MTVWRPEDDKDYDEIWNVNKEKKEPIEFTTSQNIFILSISAVIVLIQILVLFESIKFIINFIGGLF